MPILRILESPEKRISLVLRRQSAAEEKAVKDQLRLLDQMRKELLGVIADASGYNSFHLSQVLAAIDHEVQRLHRDAAAAIADDTRAIYSLGRDMVDAPLAAAGISTSDSLVGLSSEVLTSAVHLTTGEVGRVWTELGNGLKSAVRRTALGITDPQEAMAQVARIVTAKRTPFTTAAYDAERIVRTETNRVFGVATHDRLLQAGRTLGGGIKKAWLSAGDSRVREAHRDAARDYSASKAIAVDAPFVVDDEELQFPLDPRGSAANTISCRCRSIPVIDVSAAKAA